MKDEAPGVQTGDFNVGRNNAGEAARIPKSMFTNPLKCYALALRLLNQHRQLSGIRGKIIGRRHARVICERAVI